MQKYEHKERDIGAPLQKKKVNAQFWPLFKWSEYNYGVHTNIRKNELPVPMSSVIICSRSFPKLTLRSPEAYKDKSCKRVQFY